MASQQQTLEQKRAAQAWKDVQEAKSKQFKAKYGPLVKKLPSYILTNGLGQTLAFLLAKGKNDPSKEHTLLYQQISLWVSQDDKLINKVMERDSTTYRNLTAETLAYLNWLKRFAEAEPELKTDAQSEE